MLDFLKKKIIKDMLNNWIKGLLASFKADNPKIWGIMVAVLSAAKYALDKLIADGVIPETAEWAEWVIWALGLLLSTGGVAAYKHRKELHGNEVKPERMVHLSDKEKYEALLERNKVLESIVERA